MYSPPSSLLVWSTVASVAIAELLGPTYPAPFDLTSKDSLVAAAWNNLSTTLGSVLDRPSRNTDLATLNGIENITFSLGAFSVRDPAAASTLQYHYASPETLNASAGLRDVDGNSIYRVASITKLFTVFTAMLELAPTDWDRSLGSLFPELAQASGGDDSVDATDWNEVTLAALAAQIGGVAHDGSVYSPGDLLWLYELAKAASTEADAIDPLALGLPPLEISDPKLVAPCLATGSADCAPTNSYLESVQYQPPALQPWTSPGYSNNGFILLGLAISNITGRPVETSYTESVFQPLGMANSSAIVPNETDFGRYVIPGDPASAAFVGVPAVTTPSGGIFSTINDLARFGTGILNSTLMLANQTRKWMKPISFTADLEYAVGAPWEIYRYTNPTTGKITDLYTKQGDSGIAVSYLVLIPDYDVGFSILSASTSTERSKLIPVLADLVTESILPALESQAAQEAARNFAGTYTSIVHGLNSSMTLAMNESAPELPGLSVTSWISNGTDLMPFLSTILQGPEARLVQSIPESSSRRIAFRGSILNGPPNEEVPAGLFRGQYTRNIDWLVVDAATYGGVGLSLMIFDVDGEGRATAVTPAAFRTTLERTE